MKLVCLLLSLLFFSYQKAGDKIGQDSGEIPLEVIKNKPIISVVINGQTFRFLLDTGGIFAVSDSLQQLFGLQQADSLVITDINRQELLLKTVRVPSIRIGNFVFKDRLAIVGEQMGLYPYSCFGLDGMIGRDFLQDKLLHFDQQRGIFRLSENREGFQLNKEQRTKMKRSKRGLPDVLLVINGKKEYVEFDSGSGDFYSPKKRDIETALGKNKSVEAVRLEGVFSFGITQKNIEPTSRYLQRMESLTLANARYENFYSDQSKLTAARIGSGILTYGAVTLDYDKGWFYYAPYPDLQLPQLESFGFDIAKIGGKYLVKWVMHNSAAQQAGLTPMVEVISINGVAVKQSANDCIGYLNGYAYQQLDEVTLVYLNHTGATRALVLQKKRYD